MTLSYDHYLEFQMSGPTGGSKRIPQGVPQGTKPPVSTDKVSVVIENVSEQFEIFVVC